MTHRTFAGSNTDLLTAALVGRPILVSYADIRSRGRWWTETLKPLLEAGAFSFVILDSGAFTVISQGIEISVDDYAAFAAANQELFDVVVNLDDIRGDLEVSRANLATLRAAGVPAMPVFHEGEPMAELEAMLAEGATYVGFGFARKEGGRLANPKAAREAWLAEAFEVLDGRAKVHGFAMTRLADAFPFFSVDSTTWIAEYCGLRRRTPHGPASSTHSLGGALAARLADWTDAELVELAAGSYDRPPIGEASAEDLGDSKGQARTVVRRWGARFELALEALEARREERVAAAA